MNTAEILNAGADQLIDEEIDESTSSSCAFNVDAVTEELRLQKEITKNAKDKLKESIEGAIDELNTIVNELSSKAKLGGNTKHINGMLHNSLVLLIDELDYIANYIQQIENHIDMAVFDIAKKLNESIVNLIGHRKDIIFKIIETT